MDGYASWEGRSEESVDQVSASPIARLGAMLDRENFGPGAEGTVPPLAHWLYFLPATPQSGLGPDGHPARGGFLPPVHELPRRMWAGSRLAFPGEIKVGDTIVRRSTIQSVQDKQGDSGRLIFVTVRHEIGRSGEAAAIVDEHDIVYRGLGSAPSAKTPRKAESGEWRRTLVPDSVLLFRYSALTFNGHRIHYDHKFATRQEGYPGLVVHGPLIATLLVDLVRRNAPAARIDRFSFRAVSPLFADREMSVNASPPDKDGVVRLWAANDEDELAMTAEARLAGAGRAPEPAA